MYLDSIEKGVNRLFFASAFVLLALAILERVANVSGYTILRSAFAPGRLLEFSVILLLFVVVLLLRQIRQELRARRG